MVNSYINEIAHVAMITKLDNPAPNIIINQPRHDVLLTAKALVHRKAQDRKEPDIVL